VRLLIVDDNDDIRMLLRMNFKAGGFEIAGEARDGVEAVAMTASLKPDVVVMDLMMPVLDGIEATKQIKENWPGVDVVGYTSNGHGNDRVSMLGAGASAVFDKADPARLFAELEGALSA
jgi:two-component system, NarL family, response regulator LiaR